MVRNGIALDRLVIGVISETLTTVFAHNKESDWENGGWEIDLLKYRFDQTLFTEL